MAYRRHRDTLLVSNVEVLGRNCQVRTETERDESGQRFRVRVIVPVEGFDSGNGRRDRHVAEILGGPAREPVVFISEWLTAEAINTVQSSSGLAVTGELRTRGTASPVLIQLAPVPANTGVLRASLSTTFAQLGVTVPAVGPNGIIARPRPEVELLGQFSLSPDVLSRLVKSHE